MTAPQIPGWYNIDGKATLVTDNTTPLLIAEQNGQSISYIGDSNTFTSQSAQNYINGIRQAEQYFNTNPNNYVYLSFNPTYTPTSNGGSAITLSPTQGVTEANLAAISANAGATLTPTQNTALLGSLISSGLTTQQASDFLQTLTPTQIVSLQAGTPYQIYFNTTQGVGSNYVPTTESYANFQQAAQQNQNIANSPYNQYVVPAIGELSSLGKSLLFHGSFGTSPQKAISDAIQKVGTFESQLPFTAIQILNQIPNMKTVVNPETGAITFISTGPSMVATNTGNWLNTNLIQPETNNFQGILKSPIIQGAATQFANFIPTEINNLRGITNSPTIKGIENQAANFIPTEISNFQGITNSPAGRAIKNAAERTGQSVENFVTNIPNVEATNLQQILQSPITNGIENVIGNIPKVEAANLQQITQSPITRGVERGISTFPTIEAQNFQGMVHPLQNYANWTGANIVQPVAATIPKIITDLAALPIITEQYIRQHPEYASVLAAVVEAVPNILKGESQQLAQLLLSSIFQQPELNLYLQYVSQLTKELQQIPKSAYSEIASGMQSVANFALPYTSAANNYVNSYVTPDINRYLQFIENQYNQGFIQPEISNFQGIGKTIENYAGRENEFLSTLFPNTNTPRGLLTAQLEEQNIQNMQNTPQFAPKNPYLYSLWDMYNRLGINTNPYSYEASLLSLPGYIQNTGAVAEKNAQNLNEFITGKPQNEVIPISFTPTANTIYQNQAQGLQNLENLPNLIPNKIIVPNIPSDTINYLLYVLEPLMLEYPSTQGIGANYGLPINTPFSQRVQTFVQRIENPQISTGPFKSGIVLSNIDLSFLSPALKTISAFGIGGIAGIDQAIFGISNPNTKPFEYLLDLVTLASLGYGAGTETMDQRAAFGLGNEVLGSGINWLTGQPNTPQINASNYQLGIALAPFFDIAGVAGKGLSTVLETATETGQTIGSPITNFLVKTFPQSALLGSINTGAQVLQGNTNPANLAESFGLGYGLSLGASALASVGVRFFNNINDYFNDKPAWQSFSAQDVQNIKAFTNKPFIDMVYNPETGIYEPITMSGLKSSNLPAVYDPDVAARAQASETALQNYVDAMNAKGYTYMPPGTNVGMGTSTNLPAVYNPSELSNIPPAVVVDQSTGLAKVYNPQVGLWQENDAKTGIVRFYSASPDVKSPGNFVFKLEIVSGTSMTDQQHPAVPKPIGPTIRVTGMSGIADVPLTITDANPSLNKVYNSALNAWTELDIPNNLIRIYNIIPDDIQPNGYKILLDRVVDLKDEAKLPTLAELGTTIHIQDMNGDADVPITKGTKIYNANLGLWQETNTPQGIIRFYRAEANALQPGEYNFIFDHSVDINDQKLMAPRFPEPTRYVQINNEYGEAQVPITISDPISGLTKTYNPWLKLWQEADVKGGVVRYYTPIPDYIEPDGFRFVINHVNSLADEKVSNLPAVYNQEYADLFNNLRTVGEGYKTGAYFPYTPSAEPPYLPSTLAIPIGEPYGPGSSLVFRPNYLSDIPLRQQINDWYVRQQFSKWNNVPTLGEVGDFGGGPNFRPTNPYTPDKKVYSGNGQFQIMKPTETIEDKNTQLTKQEIVQPVYTQSEEQKPLSTEQITENPQIGRYADAVIQLMKNKQKQRQANLQILGIPQTQLQPQIQPQIQFQPQIQPQVQFQPQIQPQVQLQPQIQPQVQFQPQIQPQIQVQPQLTELVEEQPEKQPPLLLPPGNQYHPTEKNPSSTTRSPQYESIYNPSLLPLILPGYEALAERTYSPLTSTAFYRPIRNPTNLPLVPNAMERPELQPVTTTLQTPGVTNPNLPSRAVSYTQGGEAITPQQATVMDILNSAPNTYPLPSGLSINQGIQNYLASLSPPQPQTSPFPMPYSLKGVRRRLPNTLQQTEVPNEVNPVVV